jgi:hypothetical protein
MRVVPHGQVKQKVGIITGADRGIGAGLAAASVADTP